MIEAVCAQWWQRAGSCLADMMVLVVVVLVTENNYYRVLTTLENLEISGNSLILENSGNLKYTQGILVFQMPFFAIQSVTHNKLTCKFARLHW